MATKKISNLNETIDQMSLNHLQCRDFGHSWRPYTARRVGNDFESVLRCARCTTLRVRWMAGNGALISNTYKYADNYLTQGWGHLSLTDRNHIRLSSVLRVLPADTAAEDD